MIDLIIEWLGVTSTPSLELGIGLLMSLSIALTFILLMNVLFSALVKIFKIGG